MSRLTAKIGDGCTVVADGIFKPFAPCCRELREPLATLFIWMCLVGNLLDETKVGGKLQLTVVLALPSRCPVDRALDKGPILSAYCLRLPNHARRCAFKFLQILRRVLSFEPNFNPLAFAYALLS